MRLLVLLLVLVWSSAVAAQNTRSLAPGAKSPAAGIADLSWLVGHWQGEGIGGQSFETISPPVAGQMAGHFQQVKDGKLSFYEIYQFVPRGNSLVLRLKHFNADLSGWEEKGEAVEFPLVAIEDGAAYFDGLTMRRAGPDGMESFVVIDHKDGRKEEAAFRFKRVGF
jgi:Domain of unknown function (DUF6265)